MKMPQKEYVVEFRTPQHPSLGSNHWGGASPMLARNIPMESLELKYLKLNSVCSRDEIFPEVEEDDFFRVSSRHGWAAATPSRGVVLLRKMQCWRPQVKMAVLGRKTRRKWIIPKMDPKHRWPQGW
ncbi:hypothetical protein LIER_05369 [Lithospermum erythrorhizon]|uniref:Uncharacterized protein n=1 Tax=Lithospermum erythrorhizon TaxID=34254 RepID=A0AAV3P1J4_LITER